MELFKKFVAPALIALFTLALFILLKTSPAYKLWKGYTILSVPQNSDRTIVNDVLEQTGCGQVIALDKQRNENFSFFAPCVSLESDSYEKNKALYFFDKNKSVVLYYIPDSNKKQAQKATALLNDTYRIAASLDSHQNFPYLVPLVALIVFCVFVFISENKIVFAASGVFGILFAFCNPFYADAAAVCIELYALYLAQKVWRRRGGEIFVLKNFYILLFSFAAIVFSFTVGLLFGMLFILNLIASLSVLFLLLNLQKEIEKRSRFVPVSIRGAKTVGAMNIRNAKHMLFCAFGIFALLMLCATGTEISEGKNAKGLYFPAPKGYNGKDSDFPLLEDYFAQKWNSIASQYRSVNSEYQARPADGETVSVTRYEKDGKEIKAVEEVLYTYDDAFKKSALDSLDELEYPAIEKLWKEQGEDFSVAYTAGGNSVSGNFPLGVLVFAMLLPLSAAFIYTFVWRKKRNAF